MIDAGAKAAPATRLRVSRARVGAGVPNPTATPAIGDREDTGEPHSLGAGAAAAVAGAGWSGGRDATSRAAARRGGEMRYSPEVAGAGTLWKSGRAWRPCPDRGQVTVRNLGLPLFYLCARAGARTALAVGTAQILSLISFCVADLLGCVFNLPSP